jgi:hypothetical protein
MYGITVFVSEEMYAINSSMDSSRQYADWRNDANGIDTSHEKLDRENPPGLVLLYLIFGLTKIAHISTDAHA